MAERKTTNGGSSWTWEKGYVFLGSSVVAQYEKVIGASGATTYFVHKDHLGSTRVLTKPDKTYLASDVYDFLPYGESNSCTGSGATPNCFTGKERDTETNLDYFVARHYSSQYGRFASADLPFIDQHPANPQTWNLYFYARNNPLKFVDPTGNSVSTDAPMNHLGLLPGVHGSGPDPMTTPASDGTWGVHTIYDAETMEPISQARIALGPTAPMARHFAHVGVLPVSQTQARGPTAEQVANMLYNESAGLQPNDPGRPAWAQGTPVQTHGPFLNRSPGHLPAGIQLMVEIYP